MVSRMAISSQDVLHVARLANLSLSEEEVARMSEQLSGILEHVEALSRPDRPRPSWPRDEVLEGAPDARDGMFRVPPTS
jgi:aspartyl-tRNA(Asn)/glutamyl-tRNA(Gln) amidotransferase subunit C